MGLNIYNELKKWLAGQLMEAEGYDPKWYFSPENDQSLNQVDSYGVCANDYIKRAEDLLTQLKTIDGVTCRLAFIRIDPQLPDMNYADNRDKGVHAATKSKMLEAHFQQEITDH